MFAGNISQTPILHRLKKKVPNLCTAVSHSHSAPHHEEPSLSSSSSEEDLEQQIPRCPYLTNQGTYLNPVRYSLTCSDIPWPVINSRNQHFFKRRHLVSSWALQLKVLLVEKSEASTFKVLPPKRKAWQSVIEEHGLDRVAKVNPWKKKLYYRIQTRESVLCKLRMKYVTIWRRLSLGQESPDTVSFIFFACRYFKIFGNNCKDQ